MAGSPRIGVLALQGAFAKHIEKVVEVGAKAREVRKPEHLEGCDALILPGGESTTMRRQLEFYDFLPELAHFAKERPLFGTCAGLILMAREVVDEGEGLGLLDLTVERNAYGRQTESFRTSLSLQSKKELPAVFIRAPQIVRCAPEVNILASHNEVPVWVQQGLHMAASFHPELTGSTLVHRIFVESLNTSKKERT